MSIVKQFEQYTDDGVIEAIRNGNITAFEVLIRRANPYLYKIGRAYGYNHEDVQDLMQDTFINAYTGLPAFAGRSAFKTWIIKIMLNNCNRKRQKLSYKNETKAGKSITEKSMPMFSSHSTVPSDKTIIHKELNHFIENAIAGIPENYRVVFSLREINGLSVAETAEILEISAANVKVRLNRAKEMLRKEMEKVYSPEDLFEFNLIYCDLMVDRVMNEIKNIHKKLN